MSQNISHNPLNTQLHHETHHKYFHHSGEYFVLVIYSVNDVAQHLPVLCHDQSKLTLLAFAVEWARIFRLLTPVLSLY
jgi:hypothetical protein